MPGVLGRPAGRATGIAVMFVVAGAGVMNGQRGGADSARVARMLGAVQRAGYGRPRMVAHGSGASDPLFAFTATSRGDSGVLLVALESGAALVRPVVLERARTAADLGIRSVEMSPFLATRDVFDVEVRHQPFQLESSRTYSTHHLVRRQSDALSAACDLDGGSSSSYAKGSGSGTAIRRVVIARIPGAPLTFSVRTTALTTERHDRDSAPTSDSTESVRWFQLAVVGPCREVRAPEP